MRFIEEQKRLMYLQAAGFKTQGERLRAARRSLGLTLDDIAKVADVSRSVVSQWERADIDVDIGSRKLVPIAMHLGVAARWLIGLSPDVYAWKPTSPDEQRLLAGYNMLTPEQQDDIQSMVANRVARNSPKPSEAAPFPHVAPHRRHVPLPTDRKK